MKLSFPIIDLNELKIGSSNSMKNISLLGSSICFDETKSTYGGKAFFINEKYSYTICNDLNILLDKNRVHVPLNVPKKS